MSSIADRLRLASERIRAGDDSALDTADRLLWEAYEAGAFPDSDVFRFMMNKHLRWRRQERSEKTYEGFHLSLLDEWWAVQSPGFPRSLDVGDDEQLSVRADGVAQVAQWLMRDRQQLDDTRTTPHWDATSGRLTFRGGLARQVAGHAAGVRSILNAFQEEGWPGRLDDPLPPGRLKDTLRSINDNLALLKFSADGTGQGIRWEELPQNSP